MTSTALQLVRDPEQDARVALLEQYAGRLFLTVTEGAHLLGVDPRTLRRAIDAGDIPAVRCGATLRVPAAPFWRLAGLDPQTLLPGAPSAHQPGPSPEEHTNEAGPQQETDLADTDPGPRASHDHDCHRAPAQVPRPPTPSGETLGRPLDQT